MWHDHTFSQTNKTKKVGEGKGVGKKIEKGGGRVSDIGEVFIIGELEIQCQLCNYLIVLFFVFCFLIFLKKRRIL